jgi:hypothetical protein
MLTVKVCHYRPELVDVNSSSPSYYRPELVDVNSKSLSHYRPELNDVNSSSLSYYRPELVDVNSKSLSHYRTELSVDVWVAAVSLVRSVSTVTPEVTDQRVVHGVPTRITQVLCHAYPAASFLQSTQI